MVHRWDIVSIGNLSRNRYWGESDDQSYRKAICTSTLITGEAFCMLVDPPYGDAEQMTSELFRRTGLQVTDVDTVFLTHHHGDHVVGLPHFSHATWLAAPEVAHLLNESDKFEKTIEAADAQLFGCIDMIHTPGHTLSHHSLAFDWHGYRVLIAADAAMTPDFWANRQGYFNSVDFDAAARTIEMLSNTADIVVPGHDNYFLVPKRS